MHTRPIDTPFGRKRHLIALKEMMPCEVERLTEATQALERAQVALQIVKNQRVLAKDMNEWYQRLSDAQVVHDEAQMNWADARWHLTLNENCILKYEKLVKIDEQEESQHGTNS